jgi:hypothetical protein
LARSFSSLSVVLCSLSAHYTTHTHFVVCVVCVVPLLVYPWRVVPVAYMASLVVK